MKQERSRAQAGKGTPVTQPLSAPLVVTSILVLAMLLPSAASAIRSEAYGPLVSLDKVEGAEVLEGQNYAVGWVISSTADIPVQITLQQPRMHTPAGAVEDCDIDSFNIETASQSGGPDHVYGYTYLLYPNVDVAGVNTANRIVIQVGGNGAVLDSAKNISCIAQVPYIATTALERVTGTLQALVQVFPLPNVDVPIGSFAIIDETSADAAGGDENAVTATPEADLADPFVITSLTPEFHMTASVTVSYKDLKDKTATDYGRLTWTPNAGTNVKKIHSQTAAKYLGPSITIGNGQTKQICAHAALYDEDRWFQGPFAGDDLIDKDSICHSFRYVQEEGDCESSQEAQNEDLQNEDGCVNLLGLLPEACQDILAGEGPNSVNLKSCLLGSADTAPPATGHNGYVVIPIAHNHIFVLPPE